MTDIEDKILKAIGDDIIEQIRAVFASDVGINSKVGKNTLKDSNLSKDLRYNIQPTNKGGAINVEANFYMVYIEWDRPPKYGKRPPVKEIIKWLKRKHITSDNPKIKTVEQFAFLISRAIWRDGWKGRKLTPKILEAIENYWDTKASAYIFDELTKIIEEKFEEL